MAQGLAFLTRLYAMKYYRRLTQRDRKKLAFYKKCKVVFKNSAKWWAVVCIIMVLFSTGLICFYKCIDSQHLPESTEVGQIISESDSGLNQLEQNELERETAKTEKIVDKTIYEEDSEPDFYDFSDWNESCSYEMMVVNKKNFLKSTHPVKIALCRGKEIAEVACDDLEQMILDAKRESINLWISSGYRSIDLQNKLFERQVEREKSRAVITDAEAENRAAKVVAMPGSSEHNLGLAVDFNGVEDNFYQTDEYKWLTENAHKYGFIERYQKKWKKYTGIVYEPWHFRYVGKENATKIKESGLCLEKYIEKYLIKK